MLICSTHSIFAKEFSSSPEATELIELYTSEGCSSCPPADKWLRQLKSNPQLFTKFIPLSFHVDYWNQLGWEDRFSKKQHSDRQYRHQREGNISQVYTPGFVVNNEEWRSWRLGRLFHWPDSQKKVGIIRVDYRLNNLELNIFFTPEIPINDKLLVINTAILGMGLTSDIKLGENRGRQLKHDFVVLSQSRYQVKITKDKTQSWQVPLLPIPAEGQNQSVLVVWLSKVNSQNVIQATGGYL
ncbi:MAG: DUF1223 domain-containing protein [Methylomarinum sp.]|nr:DUF1223 domain-containing protein [Methylomarinum sp.]